MMETSDLSPAGPRVGLPPKARQWLLLGGLLVGAFALAAGVMWFTTAGRDFVVFFRESWDEAKRVVWPSRKETLQTTGIVFAFVFVMAMMLWMIDAGLLWVTQRLLGQGG